MKCYQAGKEIYTTEEVARSYLKTLQEKGYEGRIYHCKFCNRWHVGREKKSALKYKR